MARRYRAQRHRPKSIFSQSHSTAEWIILLAATGIVLTSPFGGKVLIRELKLYLEDRARAKGIREGFNSRNISQALYQLKKRHIIRVKEKEGKISIILTEKGRLRKLAYDIERMSIPRPKVWDKHWRFLVFDIPEGKRQARDAFRSRLNQLEFIQFQKSVWIYPYPCEEEISFLAEYLKVARFYTLLTVSPGTAEAAVPHLDLRIAARCAGLSA